MKKLLKLGALAGLCALAWTCNEEEFLDTPPQGVLAETNLSARAGIDAALIAAYSRTDGWAQDWGTGGWSGMAANNWVFGSIPSDDTHKGSEPSDNVALQQVELYQWAPSIDDFQAKFLVSYDGIVRANQTIRLLAANTDIGDDDRNRLLGEATFLRGHYHSELYKVFKNIPYFDELEIDFRKPNDQDILPNIIKDLEDAAALLPATQNDIGRATSGAANAILGRLHMIDRNFAAAKTALDKVQGYELQDCYHDLFSVGGEDGSGMIFSSQASVNDGDPAGDNANFSMRLANPHGGSPIGCCGFHQPTQNLVNAYRVDEDGLPLRDNSFDTNPTPDELVDPRLDWIAGRDGIPFLNWGTHAPGWVRDRGYSSEYNTKKFNQADGFSSNVGWVANQLSPINVPIIRYADVILMLAEIDVENGDLEAARAKVNQIRERAGNCAQGADEVPVPIDDPSTVQSYAVGTYDDAWTDQDDAREAVRLERRLELAFEGHRLFDLRRYGQDYFINTMEDYFDVEEDRRPFLQARNEVQARHMLFPIPTQAIQLSLVDGEPTLRQNPGY
ncbi:RagB/SusD family nutrient uptake outer membrane protein [Lewinella sp. 4G2]|uniref:RagB/SusD family nutrient uptake outer membrane protein n=1 Tax=Lewinella sp. 4G2 TaxID=1803372 RepID=UPI0007B4A689|nr:RagB/SusD family nutrient uptake outer membrane protein [Lewinella sp. 4G2]OAV45321.1 hypothetical protein A3850_012825 [Lewinella sp. 4G2]